MRSTSTALHARMTETQRQVFARLRLLRSRIANLSIHGLGAGQQGRSRLLMSLTQEANDLEGQLRSVSTAFTQSRRVYQLSEVRDALPKNGVLVDFHVYTPSEPGEGPVRVTGPPRYFAYALTADGPIGWHDLGPVKEIDQKVTALRTAIVTRQSDIQPMARTLYDTLLGPFMDVLGPEAPLILMPDGALNVLPFSTLVAPDGRYLVQAHQVRYISSAADLMGRTHQPLTPADAPLIIGDAAFSTTPEPSETVVAMRSADLSDIRVGPLPGTRVEAESLRHLLDLDDSRVLRGAAATEKAIKSARSPIVLHVATHGFFLPGLPAGEAGGSDVAFLGSLSTSENPLLRSGLALAGFNAHAASGTTNDGVLTAYETCDLDLQGTELAVLSACETGLGDLHGGEGVFGLKRALSIAGARSQVVTLWKVSDDATRALMEGYYQRLTAAEDRVEAMRQVQLDMIHGRLTATGHVEGGDRKIEWATANPVAPRSDGQWRHPYYWASFTVSGAAGVVALTSEGLDPKSRPKHAPTPGHERAPPAPPPR